MDIVIVELTAGLPSIEQLVRIVIRLSAAMLLGALVGINREQAGKPAGMRTHMLVALGSALFVLAPSFDGADPGGLSRVIQGVATGIGFIGAGAIIKFEEKQKVQGLTTAAGIWLTSAVGIAAGIGKVGIAIVGIALALIILTLFVKVERWIERNIKPRSDDRDKSDRDKKATDVEVQEV